MPRSPTSRRMSKTEEENGIVVLETDVSKLTVPQSDPDDVWDMALTGVISPNSRRVYKAGMLNFARYLLTRVGTSVPADAEATLRKAAPLLSQVTFPFVAEYREWLRDQKYSPSTVNTRLAAIDMLFKRMKRLKLIKENPADSDFVQRMRTSRISNAEGLDKDEATKLLEVCVNDKLKIRGKRDAALLAVMIFNGLRRSEVIQINLDNIKYINDTPTTRVIIKRGKELSFEFIPHVWNAIVDWLEAASIESGPIFRRFNGSRSGSLYVSKKCLTDNGVYRIIKTRIKEAGIEKNIHPHSLRHTYATLALLAGVPIQDVQISMGHASTSTTFRYYRAIEQVGRSPGRQIDIQMPKGKGDDKQ